MAREGERYRRIFILAVAAIFVLLGPFVFGYYFGISASLVKAWSFNFASSSGDASKIATSPAEATTDDTIQTKDFHMILPATSSSINLCKTLLTSAVLRYPEPIVVGWDHQGLFDGAVTHLFKITETLSYLRSLPPDSDEDLVLVLDGFDIWLQLRPDVLIKRYHSILAKNDERLDRMNILNSSSGGGLVNSKIVFGADKSPGPMLPSEAYVWAVPPSPLPADAFGNETDTSINNNRPRWLNSGTIMGPVREMRNFFAATEDAILSEYSEGKEIEHSDQYYFGQVYGPQEVNRLRLAWGEEGFQGLVPGGAEVPQTEGKRTEYGVCLDSEPESFQIVSGWTDWLTWLRFNGSGRAPDPKGKMTEAGFDMDNWTLPEDVLASEGPFSAATQEEIPERDAGWDEVVLGANGVKKEPYGLLHVTGDKSLREKWWPKQWFHPHAETLQMATRRRQLESGNPDVFTMLDGIRYKQRHHLSRKHDKAGIWRDSGEYIAWWKICGRWEDDLYMRKGLS